ncbi:hypothetical protein D3C81_992810 [compost metagenome]
MLQQSITGIRCSQGHQFLQRTPLLLLVAATAGDIHAKLSTAEQAVQCAFAQRPGLDAATCDAAAQPCEQAAFHGQALVCFAQAEAVVLHDRQADRHQPHQQQTSHQQRDAAGDQRGGAQMQLAGIADGLLALLLDEVLGDVAWQHLVKRTDGGRNHHHGAVGDQPKPHQLGQAQGEQFVGGRRRIAFACGDITALVDQLLQLQRLRQLEYAHLRFGFVARRRFQAQFGHTEQAVQQVLVDDHVVDAGERNLATCALEDTAADDQPVSADAVAVGQVLQQCGADQGHHHDQWRPLIEQVFFLSTAAEEQQCHQWQQQLLNLLLQHEQPRPRMQALFVVG